MEKRSKARRANGYVAAILVVFFMCAHILLGSLSFAIPISNKFAWIVWIGTGLVLIHMCLSIVTTREKLSNPEKPADTRKKMKIVLRWMTGILIAIGIGVHIASVELYGESAFQATPMGKIAMLALLVTLAVHITLNAKSLIRDIGGSKEQKDRLKTPLRIAVCALALVFFIVVAVYAV